jgi:hypothetical protein
MELLNVDALLPEFFNAGDWTPVPPGEAHEFWTNFTERRQLDATQLAIVSTLAALGIIPDR